MHKNDGTLLWSCFDPVKVVVVLDTVLIVVVVVVDIVLPVAVVVVVVVLVFALFDCGRPEESTYRDGKANDGDSKTKEEKEEKER